MTLKKEFTTEGGAVWAILGKRCGGYNSDYRRVYIDGHGRRMVKYRHQWTEVRSLVCHVIAVMEDGEVRDV